MAIDNGGVSFFSPEYENLLFDFWIHVGFFTQVFVLMLQTLCSEMHNLLCRNNNTVLYFQRGIAFPDANLVKSIHGVFHGGEYYPLSKPDIGVFHVNLTAVYKLVLQYLGVKTLTKLGQVLHYPIIVTKMKCKFWFSLAFEYVQNLDAFLLGTFGVLRSELKLIEVLSW